MTDEHKTNQPPKTETLELNRETLQDLTDLEAEWVQGGADPLLGGGLPPATGRKSCVDTGSAAV